MRCPQCRTDNPPGLQRCRLCAASLIGITDAAARETERAQRRRRRFKSHAITGFLLCFGLATAFGFPVSFVPSHMAMNALFGLLFGVPLGIAVSHFARSTEGGALVGFIMGTGYVAILMVFSGVGLSFGAVIGGLIYGLLPGAVMGMHVGMDRA